MNKIKDKTSKYIKMLLFIVASLLTILLVFLLVTDKIQSFDLHIYNLITNMINPTMTVIMKVITDMGSFIVIVTFAFVFSLFILKSKKICLLTFINLADVMLINLGLKYVFGRPRPQILPLVQESGNSFPSGHAMASFAFYGFIVYLIWLLQIEKKLKYFLTFILVLLVMLIGFSRIYLGVHYFSDVIAGFAIALCYLIVFITVIKSYLLKYKKNYQAAR